MAGFPPEQTSSGGNMCECEKNPNRLCGECIKQIEQKKKQKAEANLPKNN